MRIILTAYDKLLRSGVLNVPDNTGKFYEVALYKDTLCNWGNIKDFDKLAVNKLTFENKGETEYTGRDKYVEIYELLI